MSYHSTSRCYFIIITQSSLSKQISQKPVVRDCTSRIFIYCCLSGIHLVVFCVGFFLIIMIDYVLHVDILILTQYCPLFHKSLFITTGSYIFILQHKDFQKSHFCGTVLLHCLVTKHAGFFNQ